MSTSDWDKSWMVSWDSDSDSDSVVGFEKIRIRKNSDSFYPYQKQHFGWIFQNLVFSSIMIVCGVQVTLKLNFNAMWQKPIFLCAGNRLGVRHQPSIWSSKRFTSQAPQVPPGFQAGSTLRSWLCTSTDAQSAGPVLVSSLRKVVICCGPWSRSTTLAMSSWLSGMEQNFAEKLDLCYFSFHAADFPSSAILNSFQELCHRTRRLKSSFARNGYPCSRYDVLVDRSTTILYYTRCCQPISSLPARPRALHCACCMLAVRVRSCTCAGKAATRYGLGSRLTFAGRHFSIFSRSCQLLTRMIASLSSLSSSLFCQFYPSASDGVAHPDWGQRLVDVLVRAKFFFCCDVCLRSLG